MYSTPQKFQASEGAFVSSTADGKRAEKATGTYLEERGYKIRDYNWRTRFCEIDIVAEKAGVIHFVEVKYRANDKQGSGLEYVTKQKLRQMAFAAEVWVQANEWAGDYCLAAAEVSGPEYEVVLFTDDL